MDDRSQDYQKYDRELKIGCWAEEKKKRFNEDDFLHISVWEIKDVPSVGLLWVCKDDLPLFLCFP